MVTSIKKGHSRSKYQTETEGGEPAVKGVKVNAEQRQHRVAELTDEISELSRITFLRIGELKKLH